MISRRQFLSGKFSRSAAAGSGTQRPLITPGCLAHGNVVCRSCGEACEVDAIRFSPRLGGAALPEVDGGKCTGCGACVASCPAGAITLA